MDFLIGLILVGLVIELAAFGMRFLWPAREALAYILAAVVAVSGTLLLIIRPNVFSALFFIASLYRMFNFQRIIEARMHEGYLRKATRRTSFVLLGSQTLILLAWLGWDNLQDGASARHDSLIILVSLQAVLAVILLASTIRNIIKTRPSEPKLLNDSELPTLTVCIPARNETNDLQECLETILASDYPKLEVLVLDDCSQIKRTPEIIRQFAHGGVEFIEGKQPPEGWLAKNWAYKQLYDKANGDYIVFCGVDARLSPTALRKMLSILLARHKAMLSVVPERLDAHHLAIIQPMRYWWELVLPRRQFRRPPVLSSCWIAKREALQQVGDFAAAARAVVPEAYFARQLVQKDSYSFLRSSGVLGVSSVKKFQEQRATTVRTRYPQLHRRPELVMLLSLLELALLVSPFILAIAGWWLAGSLVPILAVLASVLLIASYEVLIVATMPRNALLSLVSFPFTVLVDVYLMNFSMYKYEFSEVDWKGRNVCLPAMHFAPHLPAPTGGVRIKI